MSLHDSVVKAKNMPSPTHTHMHAHKLQATSYRESALRPEIREESLSRMETRH